MYGDDLFLDYFDSIHSYDIPTVVDQRMEFLTQSTYFEVDAEDPIILIEIRFFHSLLCKEYGRLDCDMTITILMQLLQNGVEETQPAPNNIVVRSLKGEPLVTITANPLQKISQVRQKINQQLASLGIPPYNKQMHIKGKSTKKMGQDGLERLADYTLQMDDSITIDY